MSLVDNNGDILEIYSNEQTKTKIKDDDEYELTSTCIIPFFIGATQANRLIKEIFKSDPLGWWSVGNSNSPIFKTEQVSVERLDNLGPIELYQAEGLEEVKENWIKGLIDVGDSCLGSVTSMQPIHLIDLSDPREFIQREFQEIFLDAILNAQEIDYVDMRGLESTLGLFYKKLYHRVMPNDLLDEDSQLSIEEVLSVMTKSLSDYLVSFTPYSKHVYYEIITKDLSFIVKKYVVSSFLDDIRLVFPEAKALL